MEDSLKQKEETDWGERVFRDGPRARHELYARTDGKDNDQAYLCSTPQKMDRNNYQEACDDYLHPLYDPVLSEMLPGERFVMHDGYNTNFNSNDVWKRVQNGSLRYPYLQSFDLLHSKEIFGTTSAEKHYEMRLFRALSLSLIHI